MLVSGVGDTGAPAWRERDDRRRKTRAGVAGAGASRVLAEGAGRFVKQAARRRGGAREAGRRGATASGRSSGVVAIRGFGNGGESRAAARPSVQRAHLRPGVSLPSGWLSRFRVDGRRRCSLRVSVAGGGPVDCGAGVADLRRRGLDPGGRRGRPAIKRRNGQLFEPAAVPSARP